MRRGRQTLKPQGKPSKETLHCRPLHPYCIEITNFYKVFDNVTIHAIELDSVFTQDIIFYYLKSWKLSMGLYLNY